MTCVSVKSIKALWETRIKKTADDLKKGKNLTDKRTRGRLTDVWEDRILLAKLNEKVFTEEGHIILRIEKEIWKSLPAALTHLPHLQEWQIHRAALETIPHFISSFQSLIVLDLSRNAITEIPREIGKLCKLRDLCVSYNRLQTVPEELGCCENLEKLELSMNRNLNDLPRQLSNLKRLYHLDLSMNQFTEIPDSVLSLPALEWLDMSGNLLQHLPEDIHRWVKPLSFTLNCFIIKSNIYINKSNHTVLHGSVRMEKVHALWLQRNALERLPENISQMNSLNTLVLSNNRLQDIPSRMEDMRNLRFVNFRDNPLTFDVELKPQKLTEEEDDREMFGKEFMVTYIQEARKRVYAVLNMHCVSHSTPASKDV
ncbi:LOW QUALITY PROTEIN: leucine-rich repeat-containing protein 39 [Aplochiton taeniatus]